MFTDSAASGVVLGNVLSDSGVVVVTLGVSATSGVGVGLAAGATVSVFCSQAASKAAPAKMQMYFFMADMVSYLMIRGKRLAQSY